MLPRILTPLITAASSTFNHRDETLWTSGCGKAHNYFLFYSVGSVGGGGGGVGGDRGVYTEESSKLTSSVQIV